MIDSYSDPRAEGPYAGVLNYIGGCPRGWVSKSAEGRIAALSAESTKNTKTLLAVRGVVNARKREKKTRTEGQTA